MASQRRRPRTPPVTSPPPSPGRVRLFRALTVVLAPLVVLGALEAVLRLLGIGHSTAFTERCEVRGRAAACPNPDFPLRFFPPALARQPTPFVIPAEKGPRTLRVVVLGESTIHAVANPTGGLTGAIHVYGGDFVEQPRSQWGPGDLVERPFDLDGALRQFHDANVAAGLGAD